MEWTTTKPINNGVYGYRDETGSQFVQVDGILPPDQIDPNGPQVYYFRQRKGVSLDSLNGEWCGPFQLPS